MPESLFGRPARRGEAAEAAETPAAENPAETIFLAYRNAMFHTARAILGDDWAAEDAVMDALGKICAHTGDFGGLPEKSRRRLAMRITENAALDLRRRRTRRAAREVSAPAERGGEALSDDSALPEGDWLDGLTDGVSAEDAYFLAEDFGSLAEAVEGLPAKYRDAVRLRYGEGCSNAEIARLYGIPESTVSTRLDRARALLRKWLEAEKAKAEEGEDQ
ncbi:MAG: sigma-70 family RNA polymerase sigma factor [Clostridia bacterium]|nr:sigma-70 family RNA polymerase sigma factor [Clostridia bacterium]